MGDRQQLPRARQSSRKLVQAFESVEGSRKRNVDTAEPEIVADDAPVVQVVDRILTQAMRDRASDVHIEPSDDIVRVRFRIDGALKEILQLPAAIGPGLVSRIKIMANMNIVERRRPQDGQLTINDRRQRGRRPRRDDARRSWARAASCESWTRPDRSCA